MDIEQGIIFELNAVSGLENKVFALNADPRAEVPYLVFELSNSERTEILDSGHDGHVEANYQLDFYQTDFTSLKALQKLIVKKIKTWNFTNLAITGPYVEQASITGISHAYSEQLKIYAGTIELQINYHEED